MFEAAALPDQIHLSFTDHENEMRVMFVTADGAESFVSYGLDADRLDQIVETAVRRYERKDMCDFQANSSIGWRDPGFIHDGVVKNLEKGKKYFYTVRWLCSSKSIYFNISLHISCYFTVIYPSICLSLERMNSNTPINHSVDNLLQLDNQLDCLLLFL